MPLVWAANMLGEDLRQPRLRPRADAPLQRALRRAGPPRLALRRPRPGLAGPARAQPAPRCIPASRSSAATRPPSAPCSDEEEDAIAEQINEAKPDVLWVGIGVPKQEKWMARMRDRLEVPVMGGVGAAFDFHAGRISQAPGWMQERGLEWTYRIAQEPRRLLPRYLFHNPRFMAAFARPARPRARPAPARTRLDCPAVTYRRRRRPRPGRPAARALLRRSRPRGGRRREASSRCSSSLESGADAVPRDGHPGAARARAGERPASELHRAGHATPPRSTTSCSRSAPPRFAHIEIDISQIRSALDDLLPVLRAGQTLMLRSTVAPGTTEWVAGYLEQRRGFTSARTCSSPTCPSASPRTTSSRRSRRCPCIVGGVGEGSAERAAELFERVRHRDRPDDARRRPSWRRSGPTSSATRSSRSPTC